LYGNILFWRDDVRVHVFQQVEKGRNEDEVISTLVKNYIKTILKQKQRNIIPVIMSITPSIRIDGDTPVDVVVFGDNESRSRYCRKMNDMLRKVV